MIKSVVRRVLVVKV